MSNGRSLAEILVSKLGTPRDDGTAFPTVRCFVGKGRSRGLRRRSCARGQGPKRKRRWICHARGARPRPDSGHAPNSQAGGRPGPPAPAGGARARPARVEEEAMMVADWGWARRICKAPATMPRPRAARVGRPFRILRRTNSEGV